MCSSDLYADEMQRESVSFGEALRGLAGMLHKIALLQRVPSAVASDDPGYAEMAEIAGLLTPEEIQLCYQIALHGRNDLALAPDEYAGFTMTLLRMLAFRPAGSRMKPAARDGGAKASMIPQGASQAPQITQTPQRAPAPAPAAPAPGSAPLPQPVPEPTPPPKSAAGPVPENLPPWMEGPESARGEPGAS